MPGYKLTIDTLDTSFWGWCKAIFYVIVGVASTSIHYIGVKNDIVLTLTTLMIADWLTGILKAHQLEIELTSKKSNKGLIEKLMLLIIPVSIGIVFKVINIPIGITVQTVFSLLIVTELYSLIGNCYCVYTKEDIKEYDAVSAAIRWIRKVIFTALKSFFNEKRGSDDNS
jgi:phage-related holin